MALDDGSFNPASPLTNCLLINDGANGATDRCSSPVGASIPSGQSRVIGLTSCDNSATFPYAVPFAGTTPVSLRSFKVD
ncbi:MAG: hypothetical protein IPP82_02925 [Xanthomonadales bacterium]|nr:hypothetical protein [Xanthomonadales bacterium]